MVMLEIGKCYRTRDGGKVGPLVPNSFAYNETHPFRHENISWTAEGRWGCDDGAIYGDDIVSEWVDEPAPEATRQTPPVDDTTKALFDAAYDEAYPAGKPKDGPWPDPATVKQPDPYYLVHGIGPTNHRHLTLALAEAERDRLAKKHPGTTFTILKAISRAVVNVPEPTVEAYSTTDSADADDGIPF